MRKPVVKVAAVQAAPVAFDLVKSLEKVSTFTAEAARAGADLVVFPYVSFRFGNGPPNCCLSGIEKDFYPHILGVMRSMPPLVHVSLGVASGMQNIITPRSVFRHPNSAYCETSRKRTTFVSL
jgi:hypothetical protein